MKHQQILIIGAAILTAAGFLEAQEMNPTATQDQPAASVPAPQGPTDNTPVYRIQVVGREIPAINYMLHKGETKINFSGTSLLPNVKGDASVKTLPGRTEIHANFEDLAPANSFGPEYLTYVLWAITPEGRPANLGEVLPSGKKDKDEITVSTNLQSFGLVVTAEPYYAVTMPSDLVVAQNVAPTGKIHGEVEEVNAHYSLLPRGAYAETAGRHVTLRPIKTDERHPLELYEAENAVGIAEAAGADQNASDSIASAKAELDRAENYDTHKRDRKQTITFAREAVQSAEDARLITIRKLRAQDEAAAQQQRLQAEQAAAEAKQKADEEAARRAQAEQKAEEQAAQRAQAEQQAEQARQQEQAAQQQQLAAQQQQQQAEQAAQQARLEQQQAEQQAAAARQAQQQAEQNSQRLAQQTEQAREQLRQQLSQVFQTRETARGLIMDMPDVLFAFDKYNLKPEARVKLAKVSGILLAYPDLKVQVEGYTDSIGSDEYNQKLSEQRAGTVRDFLVAQKVPQQDVSSQGFGKNNPIADNTTSSGRAQNRRVELVVSGAAIGVHEQPPGTQGMNGPGTNSPAANPAAPGPGVAQ